MAREIILTRGKVAIVDDDDYNRINAKQWHATPRRGGAQWYAASHHKGKHSYMHREILGVTGRTDTDHINGNGLDNRKDNLRICTRQENSRNQRPRGGRSRFKGVFFHKGAGRWCASIHINYQAHHLGLFDTEEEAAHAYDDSARKVFGDFAQLNFIEDGACRLEA